MRNFHLDGRKLKGACHPYIKESLQLPEHYGENLDALYDCLCELGESRISIEHGPQTDPNILEVLQEAQEENPNIRLELLP